MYEREEVIWAAGFIDGEGSFYTTHRTNGQSDKVYKKIGLSVPQVERAPLDRLAAVLGGIVHGPYETAHKPIYQYRLNGIEKVQAAGAAMWSFLSVKKPQFAQAMHNIHA
ncbi:hypothetical protein LCGC14_2598600 [marine sediment metagenome]|uniref:Homing endonuclease LAGLIDADG domain-containing protein n=1 Tax=marine sediment metagenome TaxID=412755 RepID=A0A0F9D242_9ZZZZ